jgi:hypothetical protein
MELSSNNAELTHADILLNSSACDNLPIYLIQAHGEYNFNLRFRNNRVHIRNQSVFKSTENHQWIINNVAIGNLGICTEREDSFAEILQNNLSKIRGTICSSNAKDKLLQSVDETGAVKKLGLFTPPLTAYLDKTYYFFDDVRDDDTFNWSMGIIPYGKTCSQGKCIMTRPNLYFANDELYVNDYVSRIINDEIIDGGVSSGLTKDQMERYIRVTDFIKGRLPGDASYGKPVLHSEIMSILGEGIYISLSCSAIGLGSMIEVRSDVSKKIYEIEAYIQRIYCRDSMNRWGEFFKQRRRSGRITAPTALLIEKDGPMYVRRSSRIRSRNWTTDEVAELLRAESIYRVRWSLKKSRVHINGIVCSDFWDFMHIRIVVKDAGYNIIRRNKRTACAMRTKFSKIL